MISRHSLTAAVTILILASVALQAAERPAASLLKAAKEKMDTQAWRVEGLVQGDEGCTIAGIIFGRDFDLTVKDQRGESRQIAIGEKCWLSTDQGKTWKPKGSTDRRYYFLVHTPIRFDPAEKIPPFETVGKAKENGESLLHIRFKALDKVAYEGDRPNHWLTLDGDQPDGIRRYAGPLVLDNNYVTTQVRYAAIEGAKAVLPPPGNPAAVPAGNPAVDSLNAALDAMQTGLWEVDAVVSARKSVTVRGLIRGKDFDLTMVPREGGETTRQIAIKGDAWMSKDDGKTWQVADANDRLLYSWVHSPILPSRTLPPFEIVGKETRGGDPMLHLRLKVSEKLGSEKERPHYWLGLGASGEANSVRRYEGDLVEPGGPVIRVEGDYRLAPNGASLNAPGKDSLNAAAAMTKLPAPASKKSIGFFGIEERKAKLDGKIVPVEITGKVLQSTPLGRNEFQLMVKDTEKHYGLVEISKEGMQKLGLTGEGADKPITLFLQIGYLGPKPAARATAVGTRFTPGSGGDGAYSWE